MLCEDYNIKLTVIALPYINDLKIKEYFETRKPTKRLNSLQYYFNKHNVAVFDYNMQTRGLAEREDFLIMGTSTIKEHLK